MLINKNDKQGWLREDSGDVAIKAVLFMLSPFFSFLYSLRRIKTKSSFVVFFLFALFYGLCFTVVADNSELIDTSDASKWRFRFENTAFNDFSDYLQFIKEYFLFAGSDIRDLYFGTITYVVHLFSDNYHVFFLVLALVFSYFQLKSFRFLTHSTVFDNGVVCILICILFNINNISNIGGMRFWTAAWICMYGLLQYYYNGRKMYFILLLMLPLIHRGFFFIYPILILATFFKSKRIWTVAYFTSFVFSSFSTYILQDATQYLPTFLSYMIEAYTENTIAEQYSFTKLFLTLLSVIYVNVLFIIIMTVAKKRLPDEMSRIYQLSLIFITIVNFVLPIPSLGGRFLVLAEALVAFLWLNLLGTKSRYNWLIYLMPIFMIRTFYVEGQSFFRYQEADFFFMNPISLLFNHLL